MFERYFDRFSNSFATRGSRTAANGHACAHAFSDASDRRENMNSLLSLDTALAVSIFAVLRLLVIRLSLVIVSVISVIGVIIGRTTNKRPCLASAS